MEDGTLKDGAVEDRLLQSVLSMVEVSALGCVAMGQCKGGQAAHGTPGLDCKGGEVAQESKRLSRIKLGVSTWRPWQAGLRHSQTGRPFSGGRLARRDCFLTVAARFCALRRSQTRELFLDSR
ncbi:MAG: hypothetical protein A2V70_00050 [Planctomycetes bacterium RBG_13_63_9]|nr:MAG: hypothetical protein A2V70_00050 [Planctomycetes bacterium RBG_13_63_9]